MIDTGFDGIVSIPKSLGTQLGLKVFGKIELELASGHIDFGEVATLLVRLPQGSIEYIEVDVILDEEGEDILLGSRFLKLYCEDFGYDLLVSYSNKSLNLLESHTF